MSVASESRFSRSNPCPVCGGGNDDPHGQGIRCYGFASDDGTYAHCSREDYAHGLEISDGSGTYSHLLGAPCRCGELHERNEPRPERSPKKAGPPEAKYIYQDAGGTPVCRILRWPNKGFSAQRPGPSGKWIKGTEDVRLVPYRLPEVVQAVRERREVYITEGEKDADALRAAGVVATTNPFGEGKWRDEFSDHLIGGRIVIWGDNDEKGRRHVSKVRSSLESKAESVRIVWSKVGKDAADHLQAGLGVPDAVPGLDEAPEAEKDWEAPIPFTNDFDLPRFPTEALAPWHRDFVEALSEEKQVPTDLAAMFTIPILAAGIAGKLEVKLTQGWVENTALYTVCVAESGTRKSATGTDCARPVHEIERQRLREIADTRAEALHEHDFAKRRVDKAMKEALSAEPERVAEKKAALAEARSDEREAATAIPPLPQLLIDDTTPEALAQRMCSNRGRMAFISAEGGSLFEISTRYSRDGSPNLGLLLQAYSGEQFRVDRVHRDPEILDHPILNVALAVQPFVLEEAAKNDANRKRGLFARFLFALPRNNVGTRKIRPASMSEETRALYDRAVRAAYELPDPVDVDGDLAPNKISLTNEADAVLEELQRKVEGMLGEFGELRTLRDWGSKLVGNTARIALVLHATDNIERLESLGPISGATMRRAVRVAEYLIPHAKAALGAMDRDSQIEAARKALRWIQERGGSDFSKRDLHQGMRSDFPKANDVDPTLGLLEEHRFIRRSVAPEPNPKGGQPPSPRYEVNPLWCDPASHGSEGCESSEHARLPEFGLDPCEAGAGAESPEVAVAIKRPPARSVDRDSEPRGSSREPQNPQNSPEVDEAGSSVTERERIAV